MWYGALVALHVLLVEDEEELRTSVAYALRRAGYVVHEAGSVREAEAAVRRADRVDLAILDVMLPDASGIELCRRMRAAPRTADAGIVMLTARGEEFDRVMGFEAGADDYVVKPFSMRELALRLEALARRTRRPTSARILAAGSIAVDVEGHRVTVAGKEITLTALEFRLLVTLLERRGRVQSREVLLRDVWGIDADVTTRTVDTHVKRLRQKLGEAGAAIETIRGVGYRFADEPET
ncbi:MAG: DNA-binding response regulator [Deltaproteobacteria bacterium]|nr:MAG: DNA-binding response regulator [Deltaproteobacteria bacterium]